MNAIKHLLKRFEVDRAVFFGVLKNVWLTISGIVTVVLIMKCFTPELQGYYYTFASLLAFRSLMELGFETVTMQFASHEWAFLERDASGAATGAADALSRLRSLARAVCCWFLIGGLLASVLLAFGGSLFFSQLEHASINWREPWLLAAVFSGLQLMMLPLFALLQGCGAIDRVYQFQFIESSISRIALWVAIMMGAGLWTWAIILILSCVLSAGYLLLKHRRFIGSILSRPDGEVLGWWDRVWPMQWRMSLTSLSALLVYPLFTPVIFKYHGAEAAGRLGITLTAMHTAGAVAATWFSAKAPHFGRLVAKQDFGELDRCFFRLLRIAIPILVGLLLSIFGLMAFLQMIDSPYSSRFLLGTPLVLLLIAGFFLYGSSPFAIYLYAHKREPFMVLEWVFATLTTISTFVLGVRYGIIGLLGGHALLISLEAFFIFLIWQRRRFEWRSPEFLQQPA